MSDQSETTAPAGPPTDPCVHRWQISGAADGVSQGTCRLCGMTRQFTNERRAMIGHRGPAPRAAAQTPRGT